MPRHKPYRIHGAERVGYNAYIFKNFIIVKDEVINKWELFAQETQNMRLYANRCLRTVINYASKIYKGA